jgi:hypothetical protein
MRSFAGDLLYKGPENQDEEGQGLLFDRVAFPKMDARFRFLTFGFLSKARARHACSKTLYHIGSGEGLSMPFVCHQERPCVGFKLSVHH